MSMGGGDALCNFKFIIHVKASPGEILVIFFSLLLGGPLPLFHFKIRVDLQSRGMIFVNIPRDVSVVIILVHG